MQALGMDPSDTLAAAVVGTSMEVLECAVAEDGGNYKAIFVCIANMPNPNSTIEP